MRIDRWTKALVVLGLAAAYLAGAAPARAADAYVWIEAEKPTRAGIEGKAAGWGSKQFLSEETWYQVSLSPEEAAKRLPKEGALLEYDFDVKKAGPYEVWNRIGMEFVRTPFDWRIDQAAWQTITPDMLTTDLMEIDFWCEVAWIRMG